MILKGAILCPVVQGFSVFQNTEPLEEFPGLIGKIAESSGDVGAVLESQEI